MKYEYMVWSWAAYQREHISREMGEYVAKNWEPFLMAATGNCIVIMFRRPLERIP
jgi:hypothetical protein